MAETKTSHSLGKAAEAEERDAKEGKTSGSGSSARSRRDDDDDDMKPESFTYNPGPEDPEETVVFGKLVKKGEAVEFDDPKAIRKLRNNPTFWDDAKKKKAAEGAAESDEATAKQRAVAHEMDVAEALGEAEDPIDTRIPEVPQLGSVEQAKQRKLVSELVKRENERPPTEPPPEGRKGAKKADDENGAPRGKDAPEPRASR